MSRANVRKSRSPASSCRKTGAGELMRKVFRGEIPVIVHTCEGWGVMQTIRMFNDENHLKVIATHTERCRLPIVDCKLQIANRKLQMAECAQ